jgi:hypothetical protein
MTAALVGTERGLPAWAVPLAGARLDAPELLPLTTALGRRRDPAARAAYRATLARNLRLRHVAHEALAALDDAGVLVQPLKGVLFFELLYGGDLGARPASDVDLLVRPTDLAQACACLTALGFHRCGGARARFSPRYSHHVMFTRRGVLLELHHALSHELGMRVPGDRFFMETVVLDGRPVARPELQLFYVLLHAATHAYLLSPFWMVDAMLLASTPCDRGEVFAAARACGAERAVRLALQLVERRLCVHLDAEPTRGLRESLLLGALEAHRGAIPFGPNARSLVVRALLPDSPRATLSAWGDKLRLRAIERREARAGLAPYRP